MISESKLNGTFPSSQIQISGFRSTYSLDQNNRGGEILLVVRENLMTRFCQDTHSLMILKYYL